MAVILTLAFIKASSVLLVTAPQLINKTRRFLFNVLQLNIFLIICRFKSYSKTVSDGFDDNFVFKYPNIDKVWQLTFLNWSCQSTNNWLMLPINVFLKLPQNMESTVAGSQRLWRYKCLFFG